MALTNSGCTFQLSAVLTVSFLMKCALLQFVIRHHRNLTLLKIAEFEYDWDVFSNRMWMMVFACIPTFKTHLRICAHTHLVWIDWLKGQLTVNTILLGEHLTVLFVRTLFNSIHCGQRSRTWSGIWTGPFLAKGF